MPIIENHPAIKVPDDNTILWRYMDIPAFLSILTTNSLTFVRSDLFEDKQEGRLPLATRNFFDLLSQDMSKKVELHGILTTYIYCLCNKNHHMVHMWKMYSKENGVAIETTFGKIKESIRSNDEIFPSEVEYTDKKFDRKNYRSNMLIPFIRKGQEYVAESEFRLIIQEPNYVKQKKTEHELDSKNYLMPYMDTPVINCEVNLSSLISKIHISPYAPKWYKEIIEDIIKKYGLNVPIEQAEL